MTRLFLVRETVSGEMDEVILSDSFITLMVLASLEIVLKFVATNYSLQATNMSKGSVSISLLFSAVVGKRVEESMTNSGQCQDPTNIALISLCHGRPIFSSVTTSDYGFVSNRVKFYKHRSDLAM